MPVWIQATLVVVVIGLLVFGLEGIIRRRFGMRNARGEVIQHLLIVVFRMFSAVAIVALIGASSNEHKTLLIFVAGAAYFAAILFQGIRSFRRREAKG